MNGECDLDVVVAELERATLELRSAVERRDPCLANHIHARHAAAARLGAIGVRDATPGHLMRITAVIRLGRAIEREIRAWRQASLAELSELGGQAEIARAILASDEAGLILDMTI